MNTSAGAEGWLELNVTSALGAWLRSPADNHGFFITLHPHSQPGTDLLHLQQEDVTAVNNTHKTNENNFYELCGSHHAFVRQTLPILLTRDVKNYINQCNNYNLDTLSNLSNSNR